jgi:hypothetical protein
MEGIRVKRIGFVISLFYIAATLLPLNLALGLLVQVRVVSTKPIRRLHHALFFTLFVVQPCVRVGTLGHAALACGALFFYAAGLFQTL